MKLRTLSVHALLLVVGIAATGCHRQHVNNLPPSNMMLEPGPGVGGPGPGIMLGNMPTPVPLNRSQISFAGPAGMRVMYDSSGQGFFDSEPLVTPAREDFPQGAIYRLKLTDVPGRPGDEYYPTLEIGPTTPRIEAYLAHNAVPIQFSGQDFDQVQSGNFVTKVIYLPDPEYQQLALAAIETLVSTRLDPGVDPIQEADRRGAILAIVRLGNKIIEPSGGGVPGGFAGDANIQQAQYHQAVMAASGGYPGGGPGMSGPMPQMGMGMMPSHVAGVTAPQYGMPMSGTPIGLPGPPHIPLGIPAGLQRHSITNHTRVHMPPPVQHMRVNVEQKPGYSYPRPPSRVRIVEEASRDGQHSFKQPFRDMVEWMLPGDPNCE
jgi:hypothetical protein